jgi:hypothetical protein
MLKPSFNSGNELHRSDDVQSLFAWHLALAIVLQMADTLA